MNAPRTGTGIAPEFEGCAESIGSGASQSMLQGSLRSSANASLPREGVARGTLLPSTDLDLHRSPAHRLNSVPGRPLRVMKFGGTSVGDASCIRRVTKIIEAASRADRVVAVVSAMSGVTNKLIEAGTRAAAGDIAAVDGVFDGLRHQHETAARTLIRSVGAQMCLVEQIAALIDEGRHACRQVMEQRELAASARDLISGIGERLSAPIVAAALVDGGVPSEAIEATEIIVTSSRHGAAEAHIELTRLRCNECLGPRLLRGVTPVVTGFLGATVEGVPTTLGRGGSDYSATILGAALGADEVVIWKDVDGVQTADPRFVPSAETLSEASYREVADLTHFGAKVLHPGTLRPLVKCGIPVWIRNTFAPEGRGTKITRDGVRRRRKVLASTTDVALVTIPGLCTARMQSTLASMLANTAASRPGLLLAARGSLQDDASDDASVVVSSELLEHVVSVLRSGLGQDRKSKHRVEVRVNRDVALVTVVGENPQEAPVMTQRTLDALTAQGVEILAMSLDSSRGSISFVVARDALSVMLVTAHREFQLKLHR